MEQLFAIFSQSTKEIHVFAKNDVLAVKQMKPDAEFFVFCAKMTFEAFDLILFFFE